MNSLKPTAVMQEKIWIKCMRRGYIPQLRMQGPIVTPVQVTRQTAQQMIVAGITVHQIDPKTKVPTELTLQNVFPGEGDPVEPKKEEAPKATAGVTSQPVPQVNLQGVAAQKPEEKKPDEPKKEEVKEPVKAEEKKEEAPKADIEEKKEEVASEEKKDEKTEAPAQDSNNNKNNNNQKNGKKNK